MSKSDIRFLIILSSSYENNGQNIHTWVFLGGFLAGVSMIFLPYLVVSDLPMLVPPFKDDLCILAFYVS